MEKLIESLLEDFKNAFESENFEIEKINFWMNMK